MTSEPKAEEPKVTPATGTEMPAGEPKAAGVPPEPAKAYVDPSIAAELEVTKLEAQVKDLTDRLLRAHAEMDNIRKRTERDKADTIKYAITRFANDIIGVGDNFQRAISAVPPGAAEQDAALKSLIDGVQLTEREFLGVLERHGVKRLDPKGQQFDPNFHQAVMQQDDKEAIDGTVLKVFQVGYLIEERVLRPAMVVVSKGGPKPVKPDVVGNGNSEPSQGTETPSG